ncbi:armadillo-type protein [Mycena rebaudengoi]|nr:armadillo-type protein [Mycena rebaudengoi]
MPLLLAETATLPKIILMLQDEKIVEESSKALVVLARHEEVRGQIGIPSIAIIIAMLEDISVVEQAVGLIVALARIDGIRDAILTPDTIKKVYRMLEHKAQSVRQPGLYLMATLAQDAIRGLVAKLVNARRAFDRKASTESSQLEEALQALATVATHEDVLTAISEPEAIRQLVFLLTSPQKMGRGVRFLSLSSGTFIECEIENVRALILSQTISMVGSPDIQVQRTGLTSAVALSKYADVRAAISATEVTQQIVNMMASNIDSRIRTGPTVFENIVDLAKHASDLHLEDVRAKTLSQEIIQNINALMWDDNRDVQGSALMTLVALVKHAILLPETVRKITELVIHEDSDVQKLALQSFVAFAQNDDISPLILPPETIESILGTLSHSQSLLRKSALEAVVTLVKISRPSFGSRRLRFNKHSRILRASLLSQETIQKIVAMLVDADSDDFTLWAICTATDTRRDDVRIAISTPETIQQIYSMVDKNPEVRATVIECVVTLLNHGKIRDAVSTPTSLVVIIHILNGSAGDSAIVGFIEKLFALHDEFSSGGIAVTGAILEQIPRVAPATRESYMKIVKMMPLLLHCTTRHIFLHKRQQFLTVDFWRIIVALLQKPSTTSPALEMLTAFAKDANVLAKTIQSSSGIVYELLKMLKSGKTDIDQWRIGLEGLLALRLFELPKEE